MTIARKGSKRLPGKNMKLICGKPLLEWTMIQMVNTKNIANFYLVTDWEEAAKLGESYGFKTVWQPEDEIAMAEEKGRLGGPYAFKRGIEQAQKDAAEKAKNDRGWGLFDVIIPVLPTMCLRKPDDFDKAIEQWLQAQDMPVVSAVQYKDMVMYELKDGVALPCLFDHDGRLWEMPGSIWVGPPDQYMACSFRPDGEAYKFQEVMSVLKYRPYKMEFWQRFDIDYQEDFDIAEYFLERNILKGRGEKAYTDYRDHILSEYGYEQHAASYNKGVEQNLLPAEYRNSFFNHLPVYMESLKAPDDVKGWELVEVKEDAKGHTVRNVMKRIKARNGSDALSHRLEKPEPALIVGSGPSFNDCAPLLKDWKGASFCSTSQGSTMVYHGHEPSHMVAYDINTHPTELDWCDTWAGRRTVLLTHPGMHPATIDHWKGERQYFRSMDTSNFFFTNVLPVAYGDVIPSQMFLFSCSVAAQMSLAHAMGYSPLFFVGCDFMAKRFDKWFYNHEKKEWECSPGVHDVFSHKAIKSANGQYTDPLQVFYKRSTICVWRIDHSDCFQCSPNSVITEMPKVDFAEVIEKQGRGFEDRSLTTEQLDDVSEKYLAHFNQFILRFDPDENGKPSYRVLESHQRGNWEADVRMYLENSVAAIKANGIPARINVEANMERFRQLKRWVAEEEAGERLVGNAATGN